MSSHPFRAPCRRIVSGRKARSAVGRFATTTQGLVALSAWLAEAKVTPVAMEATGVDWKPVRHVLRHDFSLVLANASHVRNVPGRKSDANDATWIADLLAHGLILRQFRAAAADPGAARLDPHAAGIDARDCPSHPAD